MLVENYLSRNEINNKIRLGRKAVGCKKEMSLPLLDPAPDWADPKEERHRYVILWHGCVTDDKNEIEANGASPGIEPTKGRPNTDFGRGFYTTTIERQARHWAWTRFYDPKFNRATGIQPVVLRFRVERHQLAKLKIIAFGAGDYDNRDFWSLVQHCRLSTPLNDPLPHTVNDHLGPIEHPANSGQRWYDIACGPVAAFWEQRSAMLDADQVSFHTPAAADILNRLIQSNDADYYRWEPVS